MDLQTFLTSFISLLNGVVVPFLISFAFLFFLWNITNYFIIKGGNEKEHENAKNSALYGIAAFVFLVCLWGIINLFAVGFGFTSKSSIVPDYMTSSRSGGGGSNGFWGGGNSNSSGGSSGGFWGGGNSSGGGWWIPTSIIGDGTGSETNINTTGSEMGGNDYYYMNNNTNSETNINTTGSEVGGNDYYYMNNNTNNEGGTYIPPDDWGSDANLSNGSDVSSENNTSGNWDNYGYVDGSDTNISPDP